MGKLEGRVAVVTGASRGIGAAIAECFAKEGARVVCAARTLKEGDHRLEGSLANTVERINAAGGQAIAVATDVSSEADCRRLIDEAQAAFGPVDVLVNNAALNYYVPIVDYDVGKWMRAFAVNVHGPFMLSKFVLPGMIERRGGAIVNISSGAAIGPGRGPYDTPGRGGTMYGASKAALERLTQGLAQEVARYDIAVTCFSPSQVVPTPGTVYHKLVSGMDDPRGEPPEMMAQAALLLASEPAAKVNGRVTYSQQILGEFGWLEHPKGRGVASPGSGYAQIYPVCRTARHSERTAHDSEQIGGRSRRVATRGSVSRHSARTAENSVVQIEKGRSRGLFHFSSECGALQRRYVLGLRAFLPLRHFHRDPLTFDQRLAAAAVDRAVVDEDVLATFLSDEAEAFVIVEPLDGT
jgi:citronellol/citronellal dehydrogenase